MRLELHARPNPSDASFSGVRVCSDAPLSIGRHSGNNWVLSDARRIVSNQHCVIEPQFSNFVLLDRSTNGVLVNGAPVDRSRGAFLRDGDVIEIADYRFDVRIQGAAASRGGSGPPRTDSSTPFSITSILADIAPAGVGATGALPGDSRNELFERQEIGRGGNSPLTPPLGWDGHPQPSPDVSGLAPPSDAASGLIDQMEHVQPTQSVVDLPRPRWEAPVQRQFLPEDWNSDPVDPDPFVAASPPQEAAPADVAPVKIQEAEHSRILLKALAEGLGVDAALFAHADASTVLRNTGVMLATALSCLQSLMTDRNKASLRLGAVSSDAGGPSFVLSLGGPTAEALIVNAANFLAEAKREEIDFLAKDFETLRRHESALLEGALEALCAIARESDSATLTSRLPAAAKLTPIPMVKKAALWDMIEASETLKPLAGNAIGAGVEKLLGRAYAKRLTS